jgi:exopolysaccharide biosynthesis polyprenyl glycosylphosphotransferase
MGGGSDPHRLAALVWNEPARELHPASTEIIFIADFVIGMLLGFTTGSCYVRTLHAYSSVSAAPAPLWHEMMLGSVIAALTMHAPPLGRDRNGRVPSLPIQTLIGRTSVVFIVLLSIGLLTRSLHDSAQRWLLSWAGLLALWIGLSRFGLSRYWYRRAARGTMRERVVIVGAANLASRLAGELSASADIVVIFDDLGALTGDIGNCGSIVDLLVKTGAGAVDTVIFAFNPGDPVDVDGILRQLQSVPVQIAFCANLQTLQPGTLALRSLAGITLAVMAERPSQRWDLVLKAILDRGGACVLMILAGPLFLAAAVAIACDSPGPVIFRQARSGWGGCQITVYKFRTMWHRPEVASHYQTVRNDPRCTRVGAFLRRTSLDELPQLWNVLCGDMSLVGPRPHADIFHARETMACSIVGEYTKRYRVKPGMTGWAQIHGLRGAIDNDDQLRQRIKLDLYYIDHWSIWLDIKILARTPYAVLVAENAF